MPLVYITTILQENQYVSAPPIPHVSILIDYVGEYSPHVDSTVNFNGRLDPEKCTWMKINDASMVVLEQTEKVAQAVILFVQGLGYTLRKPLSS